MTGLQWLSLLTSWIAGVALNLWLLRKLKERKRLKEAGKALEERQKNAPDQRIQPATYNPKPFRRLTVAGKPYDPDKHFRCDGRTDNKW